MSPAPYSQRPEEYSPVPPTASRLVRPREEARLLQDSQSGDLRMVSVLQAPFSELGLSSSQPQTPASQVDYRRDYPAPPTHYHYHREEEHRYYGPSGQEHARSREFEYSGPEYPSASRSSSGSGQRDWQRGPHSSNPRGRGFPATQRQPSPPTQTPASFDSAANPTQGWGDSDAHEPDPSNPSPWPA
jgi:hypothetical protein